MLKELLKNKGTRASIAFLTNSMLGRALLRKGISIVGSKSGLPMVARQIAPDSPLWQFCVGEPEAYLYLQCTIHTDTLAEIAELAATAWVEDSPLSLDDLLPILRQAATTQKSSALVQQEA